MVMGSCLQKPKLFQSNFANERIPGVILLPSDVMRSMIIRIELAPTHMRGEDSKIYIGKQSDGSLITVLEYAAMEAGLAQPVELVCPNCAKESEEQPLTYLPDEHRFVHQEVCRDCYQDHRTNERAHPLTKQTLLKILNNRDGYSQPEVEYPLNRWKGDSKLFYDVGVGLPNDDNLEGVLVEIQHQSGGFSSRLPSRIRLAQRRNFGVHVVFTPTASGRQSYRRRLTKMKGENARVGSFSRGTVDVGTMIRPEDDVEALKVESS